MIERFLDGWLLRWPELRVALGDDPQVRFSTWASGELRIPADSGQILVARDEAMEAEWDDIGYELDSSREGPFCVAYEPCRRRALNVTALEDPYVRDGFRYDPYDVTLIGPCLYLVSVVTPDIESDFSRAVLAGLTKQLGATG